MVEEVGLMMQRAIEPLLTIRMATCGIFVKDRVLAIEPMESLQMEAKRISPP
jgi:hypothetical protein